MPYENFSELPLSVRSVLPEEAQEMWMSTYNFAYKRTGGNVSKSIKMSWTAVKQKFEEADGKWVKKDNSYKLDFTTKIDKIEIVEFENEKKEKQKKAILPLTLMDDTINKNGYRLKESEHDGIVNSTKGTPVKMQHSESDWEIVGTSTDCSANGGVILSTAEITDPKAVEKFETKTWNTKNMGVSPGIYCKDIKCSICGKSVVGFERLFHKHHRLETYEGQTCCYDMIGVTCRETSLTSQPAYWPSAGKINDITITASLDKLIEASKDTVDIMTPEETTLVESEVAKITAEKTKVEAELKSFREAEVKASEEAAEKSKAEMDDAKQTIESQKKEIAEIKSRLDGHVKESRKAEIEALGISDKELTESMLNTEMTDKEFEAEMNKTKKIMSSVKTPQGSAPVSTPAANESTNDDICKEEFGCTESEMLASITGVTGDKE